jgi:predicted nucleic acid-binding protein
VTPSEPRGPIVVDTTVFGLELVPTRADLALQYEPLLLGRLTHISFMTLAELRYGARLANWGSGRRQKLETRLAGAEVDWPGPELVDTYVDLRAQCTVIGHGLAQKEHEADRWIAATAVWLGVPLVAHDGIFKRRSQAAAPDDLDVRMPSAGRHDEVGDGLRRLVRRIPGPPVRGYRRVLRLLVWLVMRSSWPRVAGR